MAQDVSTDDRLLGSRELRWQFVSEKCVLTIRAVYCKVPNCLVSELFGRLTASLVT